MLTLFDYRDSGNGYKVRLLLSQLGIPFDLVEMDIDQGATRTADFLKINPNGRIPAVRFDDGRTLWESNALLFHFGRGTAFWPEDAFEQAEVMQWMFFEQYSHEPFIAVARYVMRHLPADHPRHAELDAKREGGYAALQIMEDRLSETDFLVRDRYSIADIALFAYTHVADQGGFELGRFPAVNDWIDRVAEQPGHVSMF